MKLFSLLITLASTAFTSHAETQPQIITITIKNEALNSTFEDSYCHLTEQSFLGCYGSDQYENIYPLKTPSVIEEYLKNNAVKNDVLMVTTWTEIAQ